VLLTHLAGRSPTQASLPTGQEGCKRSKIVATLVAAVVFQNNFFSEKPFFNLFSIYLPASVRISDSPKT
jgi:hypothetical protein